MSQVKTRSQELPFLRPNKLSVAISAVLAAPAATAVAQDQDPEGEGKFLEEVLVTATKRVESMQDIPQSIQAISEAQIKQAGMVSLDDYIRFMPSMSYVSANPGSAKVIFRGIADAEDTFIAAPSAAVYLDEQSLTMNATPDPRMVDIERIEALSGPQGTLYGASSQAGTLRIITNKPDPSAFDANVSFGIKSMSEGDSSYDASAMVNIPTSDTSAIRLVGFSAKEGGFIDNVFGPHPRFGIKDNAGTEQDNFNEVSISGGRISARWFPSDDWTVTAGVIYQKTDSDGRPEMDPTLGDLKIVRFRPDKEYDRQDWTQYALTFEGDLGFAKFVSATSYFERDWEYTQDTTSYAAYFGTFCYGGSYDAAGYFQPYVGGYSKYCFQPAGVGNYYNEPVGYLKNTQKNTKFAQEFRLSAQGDKLDWVAGVFYEKATEDWDFTTVTDGYSQSQSIANYLAGRLLWSGFPIPTVINNDDVWWNSFDRTNFEQKAVFGEATFHMSEDVDFTVGGRYFQRTMDKKYWVDQPSGNLSGEGILTPSSDDTDFVPKLSVKYAVNDDVMVYGLYSEGFRPGGTNRGRGFPFFPASFNADTLQNVEFGVKTTLAEGRVRLNATFFDMSWNDYQLEVVDPSNIRCDAANALPAPNCGQPWQKVVANVGNASSQGFELQFDAAPNENLTLGFNATWLDATLDEDVEFNPGVPVPAGSRLPLSPEFKAATYATYTWPVDWFGGNSAYVRLQWSYTGDMFNQVEPLGLPAPQFLQPSYQIGDIKFGIVGDDWSIQLFANNVTDERAILFNNPYEFDYFFGVGRLTVNRPREYGIRFSKSFSK